MKCYSEYLIKEYPEDIDCDFIFVVCKPNNKSEVGQPITYQTVDSIFRRISKKTGIKANPHLLRHTHATELIRSGWKMEQVQKRLGHSDVQTTINTYVHLTDDDLISAYKKFIEERDNG